MVIDSFSLFFHLANSRRKELLNCIQWRSQKYILREFLLSFPSLYLPSPLSAKHGQTYFWGDMAPQLLPLILSPKTKITGHTLRYVTYLVFTMV